MALPTVLFLFALAVRGATAAVFGDPAYPDSYYYVNLARALASGEGFQVDYIWNFVDVGGRLPEVAVLPIPSNAHWMPLAALVQVPFIWLLGATTLAAGVPFWLAAAATAPLTFAIALDAGLDRRSAAVSGALAAVPGAASPFLAQPDSFALFMPLGALALWACARGLRGDRRAFALGGIVVGIATLARADGVLLGVPFAFAFLADLLRRDRARRIGWAAALGCAAGALVVVAPWLLRQVEVFGTLAPSAESGRILWIDEYRDLYSVSGDPTLGSFLAQGPAAIALSRAGGLVAALGIFATVPLLLFLAPVVAVGAWTRRRAPAFAPWLVYACALFASSALLFAVHVPYGTFLHSGVALLPHAYILAVVGIAAVARAVARRRRTWDGREATRILTLGAAGIAIAAGLGSTAITAGRWDAERQTRLAMADALASAPRSGRLMSPDAGAYRFHAGREGIVTPDDPLPVVEQALRAYDVRWLILERAHVTRSLAPVLAGAERPPWLSEPVVRLGAPTAATAALYAVCLEPADERCSR